MEKFYWKVSLCWGLNKRALVFSHVQFSLLYVLPSTNTAKLEISTIIKGRISLQKKKYMKNIKDIPKQSKSFSVAIFHPNLWSIYVESSRILRNSDWFRLQKCYVVPIVLFPVFTIYTSIIWGRKKSMWSIWRITSCDNTEDSKLSTKNTFPFWVLQTNKSIVK